MKKKKLKMRRVSSWLSAILFCVFFLPRVVAQCPDRPDSGTIVNDPFSLSSQNGSVSAQLTIARSVDNAGYTHYCYKYNTPSGIVEAPTFRLNPGDHLLLDIVNQITSGDSKKKMQMKMPAATGKVCGDGGEMTPDSTNVHFHGLNVPPVCHQDDVINTLIQPGTPGFHYDVQIPLTEPPGLYWYHPHIHEFTEFQVNGGAAGAIIVEGMEKYRPEVTGLTERVFVIRQQYLVPWIPGPYQLSINYQVTQIFGGKATVQMKPGEKQFWRVANATLQDFLQLQLRVDGTPQPLELVAFDGYPLPQIRTTDTILVPPAGRAEFIVQAPTTGGDVVFYSDGYDTGPTGNFDVAQLLAQVQVTDGANTARSAKAVVPASVPASADKLKFSGLADQAVTAKRKLFFSEEFGGTNGPIQFYITVDGQKQKIFDPNEKPVITTKVGAIEDWTIENRALETHAFHMHQIHFQVLEVDGKPVSNKDLRDTIEIPFWEGKGPFHSVKLRMDFRDPTTAGMFLFHCHILLHEDLGMMHKILVEP